MVLSGSGERVMFVHERPEDESLVTGGTIARLRSADVPVVVVFGGASDNETGIAAEAKAALAELDVDDWRTLAAASADPEADLSGLREALRQVIQKARPTAVVIGTVDDGLRLAAPNGQPFPPRAIPGGANLQGQQLIFTGHFTDPAADRCVPDRLERCRETFVVSTYDGQLH